MSPTTDGTVTLFAAASAETREAMMEAVREANGRRAIRPAETVADAAAEIEAFLVVPAWADGETAAHVAAETLRAVHGLDASAHSFAWMLYTEGARRLGFPGPVPAPVFVWEHASLRRPD